MKKQYIAPITKITGASVSSMMALSSTIWQADSQKDVLVKTAQDNCWIIWNLEEDDDE